MYPDIDVMNRNKELSVIKHIETNYIIFWKQHNSNNTTIYPQHVNQIWKSLGRSLKWLWPNENAVLYVLNLNSMNLSLKMEK